MLAVALVVAMVVSAGIALLLERVAYRPLIKRSAPKLVALISAIGASFVLAEVMGLRGNIAAVVRLDGRCSDRYVAALARHHRHAGRHLSRAVVPDR